MLGFDVLDLVQLSCANRCLFGVKLSQLVECDNLLVPLEIMQLALLLLFDVLNGLVSAWANLL